MRRRLSVFALSICMIIQTTNTGHVDERTRRRMVLLAVDNHVQATAPEVAKIAEIAMVHVQVR